MQRCRVCCDPRLETGERPITARGDLAVTVIVGMES